MQGCCKVSSSICEARWALFDNQLGNEIGSFSDPFDAENAIEAGWTTGLVPFTYENGIGFIENMSAFETNFRFATQFGNCLLYTSPSPRDATLSRMPSSA